MAKKSDSDDLFKAVIAEAHAATNAVEHESAIVKAEKFLTELSLDKGPASPEADAMRREINIARAMTKVARNL